MNRKVPKEIGVEYADLTLEEMEDQLKALGEKINYADAAFESYLLMAHGPEKWNEVYKNGGAFWKISRKALFESALLYIHSIYVNLKAILNMELRRQIAMPEKIADLRLRKKNLNAIKKQFDNLRIIRNKSLAHFDSDYINKINQLFVQHSLKVDNIRDMIGLEREACNALAGRVVSARYYNYNDISQVLDFCYRNLEKDGMDSSARIND